MKQQEEAAVEERPENPRGKTKPVTRPTTSSCASRYDPKESSGSSVQAVAKWPGIAILQNENKVRTRPRRP